MQGQTQTSPQAVTRRLLALCALALTALALLTVAGQALVQWDLKRQSDDSHVINIAGRQRMLSQKLAKAALAIRFSNEPTTRALRVEELQTVAGLWERCQSGLQQGDAGLKLPGDNPPKIRAMYAGIEPQHQAMLAAARALVASAEQQAASKMPDPGWSPYVQAILQQETSFLPGMDAIVTEYDREAKARVTQLKDTELALLGVTLLVLLLEGVLIFRPAIHRVGTAMTGLMEAEDRIARQNGILAERNTQLEAQKQELQAHQSQLMEADARVSEANTQLEQAARRFDEWKRKAA